jgi:SAM-dependent methyltransferase
VARRSESSMWPERLTRGSYDDLAHEYYDAERHPTCANFREGSLRLVERWLGKGDATSGTRWDVGAGESVLAEVLAVRGVGLGGTTALDDSPSMLAHSEKWTSRGLGLAIGDAEAIPAENGSAALVVASLGDPYNTDQWWTEVARVLAPGGICIFTTPTHEWAESFRDGAGMDVAEFELADGRKVLVPSLVHSPEEQMRRIEQAGLRVDVVEHVTRGELRVGRLSPKLLVLPNDDAPVLRGYGVVRP